MSTLNSGPYQHNRFAAIDNLYERERQYYTHQLAEKKKAKPDFLDVDGDNDKEESFEKGVKDKEKGEGKKDDKKEGKKEFPAFLQKKKEVKENRQMAYSAGESEGKKSMKSGPAKVTGGKTYTMKGKDGKPLFQEAKCSSGCDCEDCKKDKKKAMTEWIHNLVNDGYDLSEYNMEQIEILYDQAIDEENAEREVTIEEAICQYLIDNGFANNHVSAEVVYNNMSEGWRDDVVNEIVEIYQGKHGQSEKQYQDGRSDAGKMISGDSKGSGANYSYNAKNTGSNPAGGSQKPQGQGRMTKGAKNDLLHRKGEFMKKQGYKAK